MKFVALGKPAINTSGTEGTDYPASGKTWIVSVTNSAYHSGSYMSAGFGQPVLILSRNASGGWLQNDGSFSANATTSVPTTWINRQTGPDDDSNTVEQYISDAFTADVGQEGIDNNSSGESVIGHALACYTFQIDTLG